MISKNAFQGFSKWLEVARTIGVDIDNVLEIQKKTVRSSSGIDYVMIYSPKRAVRPDGIKDEKQECNMCKEWRDYRTTNGKNVLTPEDYGGYMLFPNKFPIDKGHLVIIQPLHDKKNWQIDSADLVCMQRLAKEKGYGVWHNMKDAASTFEHDHFQALPGDFPIDSIGLDNLGDDYALASYPIEHRAFIGGDSAENAMKYIKSEVERKNLPYNAVVSRRAIYVFPVRVPQYKGGVGGLEFGGAFVARTEADYNSATGDALEKRLKDAGFDR